MKLYEPRDRIRCQPMAACFSTHAAHVRDHVTLLPAQGDWGIGHDRVASLHRKKHTHTHTHTPNTLFGHTCPTLLFNTKKSSNSDTYKRCCFQYFSLNTRFQKIKLMWHLGLIRKGQTDSTLSLFISVLL